MSVQFDEDEALRERVEERVSRLLTELNRAHYFEEQPNLSDEAMTEAGRRTLLGHWDRAPFRCPAPSLTRSLHPGRGSAYEVRSIPLLVGTDSTGVTTRSGVLSLTASGRIENITFASERTDPPEKTGTIVVRTEPSDARVTSAIGEGTRQRAPVRFEDVPADVYAFTIRRARYRDIIDTTLAVRAGRTAEYTLRLSPKPGALRVQGVPSDATVRVDGDRRADPADPRPVAAGPHQVRVTAPSFAAWDSTVTVPPGDTLSLAPTLRRSRTPLVVRSSPPDARVVLDGTPVGRTPLDSSVATGGSHTLRVEKKGYVPSSTVRFDAAADSVLERRVVLTAVEGRSHAESARFTNLRAERVGTGAALRYTLVGESEATYSVGVRAVGPDGATITLPDSAVQGAVGDDLAPGEDRQVTVRGSLPDGTTLWLTVEEEGGRRWLYLVGGAVVAGGSTLVALLIGGDDGGRSFPAPPGLPN